MAAVGTVLRNQLPGVNQLPVPALVQLSIWTWATAGCVPETSAMKKCQQREAEELVREESSWPECVAVFYEV